MMITPIVHMFWAYGGLRALERLSMRSFLSNGFHVVLWSYEPLAHVPEGVETRDASEILPESAAFLNSHGTHAGTSDLFRYAVLTKRGGLYADCDVVALRPAERMPKFPFLPTERTRDGGTAVLGNVIHHPVPREGDMLDMVYRYALHFPKERVAYTEIGPALLTAIAGIYPDHGFTLMEPDFANGVDWWTCPGPFLETAPPPDAMFLHLYSEMWRRKLGEHGKDGPFPPESLIGRLAERYGVEGELLRTS